MNIFVTNTLTSNQYNDARELISKCSMHDGTRGVSFLEPELNDDMTFPCFYMMYSGDTLVSFLSVFMPDENQCEVYGNTLPEYRKNGYFTRLWKEALTHIKEWSLENVFIVNEPESVSGQAVLKKLGAVPDRTEYLMSYDMGVKPEPAGKLEITYSKDDNTEIYGTYVGNTPIGSCKVEFTRTHAVIYDFQILPEHRGNGYGTEMLLMILKHLMEEEVSKILLHVSGANTAAHAMYSHHGFVSEEQLDYWRLL